MCVCVCFCGLPLLSFLLSYPSKPWHVLTPAHLPFSSPTPSSSPDSSGHLQSHPTLPITSSILVTVAAPQLNPPLSLTEPTLLSGVSRGSARFSSAPVCCVLFIYFVYSLHISVGRAKNDLWVFGAVTACATARCCHSQAVWSPLKSRCFPLGATLVSWIWP